MPAFPPPVRPGDLITADLMNQIISGLQYLDNRLTSLQQSSGGAPAQGYILVSTRDADALELGIGDQTRAFRFRFAVWNNTLSTLPIQLTVSVTGLTGNWGPTLESADGTAITQVLVPGGQTTQVAIALRVPAGAVGGETGSVQLAAAVGPPHNKNHSASFTVRTATQTGPPQTRQVALTPTGTPSAPFDAGSVSAGVARIVGLSAAFTGSGASGQETFQLTARVTPSTATVGNIWTLEPQGLGPVQGTLPAGTVGGTLPIAANDTVPESIRIRVTPPAAAATVDQTADLSFTIASTTLTPAITASTTLRLTLPRS